MRSSLVRGCVLLFLCACAGAPPAANKPEEVALRFDWGDGLAAHVTSDFGGKRPTTTSYDLKAEPHGDELVLVTSGFETNGTSTEEAAARAASLARIVVGRDGSFRRLEGVEASVAELLPALPGIDEKAKAQLSAQVEKVLQQGAQREWSALAGFWNGKSLEIGRTYERIGKGPIALAGGAIFDISQSYVLTGRVPCSQGEQENRCVELRLTEKPTALSLTQITEAVNRGLSEQAGTEIASVIIDKIEDSTVLVTEPQTLKPHMLRMTNTLVTRNGTEHEPITNESVAEYRYDYSAR
jgi:hypothetical protein